MLCLYAVNIPLDREPAIGINLLEYHDNNDKRNLLTNRKFRCLLFGCYDTPIVPPI